MSEQQDWRPVPDPTILTTQQLLRELAALREVFETRLDAMDKAAEVLDLTVNRTPTVIQTAIAAVREIYDERFASVQQQLTDRGQTYDQRFTSIAQQFSERDVRTDQAATASASALAAALQAAKEAVFEQAQAAAKAADKTELSFTKQIDLLLAQIKALGDTFGDRLAELKERIDRGEGTTTGAAGQRTETRAGTSLNMQGVVIVLAAVAIIVTILLHK